MKGIASEDLSVKVHFIYYGETKIRYENLEYFIFILADKLCLKRIDKETT